MIEAGQEFARFQDQLIGLEAVCPCSCTLLFSLGIGQVQLERLNNSLHDRILNGKDVVEFSVIALRPHMPPGRCIYELSVDPHLVTDAPNAALQHVSHAQLLGHPLNLHLLALVGKRRGAGDDEQARHLGQIGDQILGHAIGKILLTWVVAYVHKRQDDDGGSVGQRKGHPLDRGRFLARLPGPLPEGEPRHNH